MNVKCSYCKEEVQENKLNNHITLYHTELISVRMLEDLLTVKDRVFALLRMNLVIGEHPIRDDDKALFIAYLKQFHDNLVTIDDSKHGAERMRFYDKEGILIDDYINKLPNYETIRRSRADLQEDDTDHYHDPIDNHIIKEHYCIQPSKEARARRQIKQGVYHEYFAKKKAERGD